MSGEGVAGDLSWNLGGSSATAFAISPREVRVGSPNLLAKPGSHARSTPRDPTSLDSRRSPQWDGILYLLVSLDANTIGSYNHDVVV